ncbi:MAG: PilZ domain-containing protein [Desulfobacteraceae bacterium]
MNDARKKDVMTDLLSGEDEIPSGDRDLDCYIYRSGGSPSGRSIKPDPLTESVSEGSPGSLSDGIEMVADDPAGDRPSRRAARIYVKERPDCTVTIENNTYPLKDISMTGLGVSIETEFVFQLGEFLGDVIKDIRVDLMDECLDQLEYKIVHISPDTRNNLVCGMVWLNPTQEKVEKLFHILKRLKGEKADD